ncbi:hypothetical protein [Nocardioides sp.]|uniref:hypothetical protein n=1 Tax=Nocardioides sp. TaxID=35761 RepID=UPI002ED2E0D9
MRIDHRRPLAAYFFVALACALVMWQPSLGSSLAGPGPVVKILTQSALHPGEVVNRLLAGNEGDTVPIAAPEGRLPTDVGDAASPALGLTGASTPSSSTAQALAPSSQVDADLVESGGGSTPVADGGPDPDANPGAPGVSDPGGKEVADPGGSGHPGKGAKGKAAGHPGKGPKDKGAGHPGKGPKDKRAGHPGKGPKDKRAGHPGKGPKDKRAGHPGKGPKDKGAGHPGRGPMGRA